ncbi:MAG: hypothetical protein ABJN34_09030 [Litoreibacter sp.]|uniref:hypothetical protein n=1 Tax=Litoreibacter sp. TaxID=1969459 RepID=UPI00329742F2
MSYRLQRRKVCFCALMPLIHLAAFVKVGLVPDIRRAMHQLPLCGHTTISLRLRQGLLSEISAIKPPVAIDLQRSGSYLTRSRQSKRRVADNAKVKFEAENVRRAELGLPLLKVPSKRKTEREIAKLDPYPRMRIQMVSRAPQQYSRAISGMVVEPVHRTGNLVLGGLYPRAS